MLSQSLLALLGLILAGLVARWLGAFLGAIAGALVVLWALFALFVVNFFRDPEPQVPGDPRVIVAPAHGKVDVIDETTEPLFLGGPCRRVSIFLSVVDVHVQNAPIAGKVAFLKHTPGEFLNAMRTDCARFNENVLVGFESSEAPGEKIGVRLIAGLIARRIVPWIQPGEPVARGQRISLIQFGSRVDCYLPLSAQISVKLGEHVRGGESVIARRS
jgi:phosphatidylserine decarboxylase